MKREDEIMQAAEKELKDCPYINTTLIGVDLYLKGAQWADAHPAEETIHRIVRLYKRWYTTESQTSIIDFVKSHWNDSL